MRTKLNTIKELKTPKNAGELTTALMLVFNDVREKKMDSKDATNLSRVADTTIRNLKNQIIYHKNMGKKTKIKFLEA